MTYVQEFAPAFEKLLGFIYPGEEGFFKQARANRVVSQVDGRIRVEFDSHKACDLDETVQHAMSFAQVRHDLTVKKIDADAQASIFYPSGNVQHLKMSKLMKLHGQEYTEFWKGVHQQHGKLVFSMPDTLESVTALTKCHHDAVSNAARKHFKDAVTGTRKLLAPLGEKASAEIWKRITAEVGLQASPRAKSK